MPEVVFQQVSEPDAAPVPVEADAAPVDASRSGTGSGGTGCRSARAATEEPEPPVEAPAFQPSPADASTIAALTAAAENPALQFQASAQLGRLLLRLDRGREGVAWLERATQATTAVREQRLDVMYELADALERIGERTRALDVFADLDFDAASYRDVPSAWPGCAARSRRAAPRDAAAPGGVLPRSRVRPPRGAVVLVLGPQLLRAVVAAAPCACSPATTCAEPCRASASSTCWPRSARSRKSSRAGRPRCTAGADRAAGVRTAVRSRPVTPVMCLVTDRQRAGGADASWWSASRGRHVPGCTSCRCASATSRAARSPRWSAGCVDAVRGSRARVVVNDRVDVALAAGAHGVHLRADSMPAARVRTLCPPGFLVGRSVHGLDEAEGCRRGRRPRLPAFGTVFATASKPGRAAAGTSALAAVAAAVRVPVLAVGGVTPDNLDEVAAAGASGFAAIGMFAAASETALVAGRGARRGRMDHAPRSTEWNAAPCSTPSSAAK